MPHCSAPLPGSVDRESVCHAGDRVDLDRADRPGGVGVDASRGAPGEALATGWGLALPHTSVHRSRSSVALAAGRWCRRCPARSPRAARRWCPRAAGNAQFPLGRCPVGRAVHAGVGRGSRCRRRKRAVRSRRSRPRRRRGGEHVGRHAAAGRQARDEDASGVAAAYREIAPVHHLFDRQCLATAAALSPGWNQLKQELALFAPLVWGRPPRSRSGRRTSAIPSARSSRSRLRAAVQVTTSSAGGQGVGHARVHGELPGLVPNPVTWVRPVADAGGPAATSAAVRDEGAGRGGDPAAGRLRGGGGPSGAGGGWPTHVGCSWRTVDALPRSDARCLVIGVCASSGALMPLLAWTEQPGWAWGRV